MLKGQKLPCPTHILASVITVTYIGHGVVPKNWLKTTFCVQCQKVLEALQWLIHHNAFYAKFSIDQEILASLPEDDIPLEIQASMCQEPDSDILNREADGYVDVDLMIEGVTRYRSTNLQSLTKIIDDEARFNNPSTQEDDEGEWKARNTNHVHNVSCR